MGDSAFDVPPEVDATIDEQRANSLPTARDRLATVAAVVDDRGVVHTASATGNLETMNRLVDATGVPVGRAPRSIAHELDLPT